MRLKMVRESTDQKQFTETKMYPVCPFCFKNIKKLNFTTKDAFKINLKWDGKGDWDVLEEHKGWEMEIKCPNCKKDITDAIYANGMYIWHPSYLMKKPQHIDENQYREKGLIK